MAKFINRKEEVLQIELTAYGKQKFSQGKFLPKHYAFFDDDILYDEEYREPGSNDRYEAQNDIVDRIKETPRLEIHSTRAWALPHVGWESSGEVHEVLPTLAVPTPGAIAPSSAKFLRPLGRNSPLQEFAPAWNIQTIGDSMPLSVSGSEEYPLRGGDSGSATLIPALSASLPLEYERSLISIRLLDGQLVQEGGSQRDAYIWELTRDGRLLLDIQEVNTFFKGNGNFDIEVFRVPPPSERFGLQLKRLDFINNDFDHALELNAQLDPDEYARVLSGDEEIISKNIPKLDASYVEYFLSIKTDDEIDDIESASTLGSIHRRTETNADPVDPCDEE